MSLTLPRALVDEMIAHAQEDLPNECCGVIGRAADGALTLWRATNDEASPWRFNIPPQQVMHIDRRIDEGDWLVIYHSHVASEARPSPTDLRIARLHKGATEWPYWVLVSLKDEQPSVRAWRIDDGDTEDSVKPAEIELQIVDGEADRKRLEMIEVDGRPRVRETSL